LLQFLNCSGYFCKNYFNSKIAWYKNGTRTTSTGTGALQDNMNTSPRTLQLDVSFHTPEDTYFSSLFYPLFTLPFSLSTPSKGRSHRIFHNVLTVPIKCKEYRKCFSNADIYVILMSFQSEPSLKYELLHTFKKNSCLRPHNYPLCYTLSCTSVSIRSFKLFHVTM